MNPTTVPSVTLVVLARSGGDTLSVEHDTVQEEMEYTCTIVIYSAYGHGHSCCMSTTRSKQSKDKQINYTQENSLFPRVFLGVVDLFVFAVLGGIRTTTLCSLGKHST